MVADRCDRCGAPAERGQPRCAWCGAPHAREAPPRAPPAASPRASYYEVPMFGGHWRSSMVVVGCAITVLAVIFLVVFTLGPIGLSPPVALNAVHVTEIVVNSPDNACGLSGADAGPFTANGSSFYLLGWVIPAPGGGTLPCSVENISTTTPGFGIVATLPVTATATTNLTFDLLTPLSYSGPLEITFL